MFWKKYSYQRMAWGFGLKNMLIVLSSLPTFNFTLNLMQGESPFITHVSEHIGLHDSEPLKLCSYEWRKWNWSTTFLTVISTHAPCLLYRSPDRCHHACHSFIIRVLSQVKLLLRWWNWLGASYMPKWQATHTHNNMSGSGRSRTFTPSN
jgi:hypothetical protein